MGALAESCGPSLQHAISAALQEELLLWRDQKRSALVLGVISAGFGVVQFAKINAIQSAAYLLLAAVLGCFLWNQVAGFTHK